MTGIIFDIQRFAVHDGPGIRTTVFLKGCPLRCYWCHNPESIEQSPCRVSKVLKLNGRSFTKEETVGYAISTDSLFAELEKARIFMDESGGGVTFSGGEPLFQHDFLMDMLMICKKNGIHTTVDTSLYASFEKVRAIAEIADLLLVDLKLIDNRAHQKYTGVANTLILDNIRKLSVSDVPIIIRIPLIPGITAITENIKQTISFLQSLNGMDMARCRNKIRQIDLLPFHNSANEKYRRIGRDNRLEGLKPLHQDEIKDIEKQFINAGFNVKTA